MTVQNRFRVPVAPRRMPALTVHELLKWPMHKIEAFVGQLSEADIMMLFFEWPFWGRPAQLAPPGSWAVWLILAGRGWGKTKTAVQWAIEEVISGRKRRLAFVARTAA